MRRGDLVIVAAAGDYGNLDQSSSRQTRFPTSASVVICQLTAEMVEAPDFRITIDPSDNNGLRARSQIMADKPVTVRRARIGQSIGYLNEGDLGRLNAALAFLMGVAA